MGSGLEELGIVDDGDDGDDGDGAEAPQERRRPRGAAAESEGDDRTSMLVRTLRKVSLFEGLLPLHLKRISALCLEVEFAPTEAVFSHGDPGDGLYLILEGAVRISRRVSGIGEEALAVLKPGQYFGEMSIVDDEMPRSADAIAHERSRLLKLPKDDLRDLMFVDRELAYELLWRFVRTLSGRLRDSNDKLLMLTVSSKF
jgi:CRP/FNR family cyclic AMP-dependent transcriptional regulator